MSRPAADCFDEVGDAFGGGVGAVGAAEGVVDVDVAERGELLGEGGIVGFFFGVEAEVFEQEGLAGFEVGGHLAGDGADAVGGEGDVLVVAEDVVEQSRAGGRRRGGGSWSSTGLPLGRPRCEQRMTLALWRSAYSMVGRVSRMRVSSVMMPSLRGDVEVDADEDALVGEIEVADGQLRHLFSFWELVDIISAEVSYAICCGT